MNYPSPPRTSGRARAWLLIGGLILFLCVCSSLGALLRGPVSAPGPVTSSLPIILHGTGPTDASTPFTLDGGAYTVAWAANPPTNWPTAIWHLGMALHTPGASVLTDQLLFSQDAVDAAAPAAATLPVTVAAGTYVLSVAAADTARWTLTLSQP